MIPLFSLPSCTSWAWRTSEEAQLHRFQLPGNVPASYKYSLEFFFKIAKSIMGELSPTLLMFLSDWSHISIAVILNLATLITFFVADNPPKSPFRLMMIYPDTVILTIMACRVFRNLKLGRHSQVLITPTQINTGNLTQLDCIPGTGGEDSYHMGDMNIPMSVEVSRWKELAKLHIPDSQRQGIENPKNHLGGVKVTKVVELTRSWKRVWRFINIRSWENSHVGSTNTGLRSRPD